MGLQYDKIAQSVLEKAEDFVNDHLIEGNDGIHGSGQYEVDGSVIVFEVYPLVTDKFKDQLKEKQKTSQKKRMLTPFGLMGYFNKIHYEKLGYLYAEGNNFSSKDMGMAKILIKEYGELSWQIVDWFLKNYKSLPKYQGAPTMDGLIGYRKTVRHEVAQIKGEVIEDDSSGDGGVSI